MIYGRPQVLDHVYVSQRDLNDEMPYGYVIGINREEDEAVVKFFSSDFYVNDRRWSTGFKSVEFIGLAEFAGCWSSHDGGEGEWKL